MIGVKIEENVLISPEILAENLGISCEKLRRFLQRRHVKKTALGYWSNDILRVFATPETVCAKIPAIPTLPKRARKAIAKSNQNIEKRLEN